MTAAEFANTVTDLPIEKQNEFFDNLKSVLSEEDYIATVKYVSFIGLFKSQEKYKALRSALCEALFGVEVPFTAKTMFDA